MRNILLALGLSLLAACALPCGATDWDRTAGWPRDPKTGVLRGAEPIRLEGTNGAAVLLLHSFASSPGDFTRMARELNAAGFTVVCPRFEGHGTTPADLRKATAAAWLRQADGELTGLRKSHDRVYAVGLSLGGLVALHLAATEQLDGVVALAPALEVSRRMSAGIRPESVIRMTRDWLPYVRRTERWIQANDRSMVARHVAYSRIPTAAVGQLMDLASVVRAEADRIEEPLLVIHARADAVASPQASEKLLRSVASRRTLLIWLERSKHMITIDHERESVDASVVEFLTALEGRAR